MAWIVEYIKAAETDLKGLDHSQQIQILKAIKKVAANPLPNSQGGYGKPLGNRSFTNLTGYLKIKLLKLGMRVVYRLVEEKGIMRIIIISVRDDERVYKLLQERIKK
jgi:mRNA interferase RelE/StbE